MARFKTTQLLVPLVSSKNRRTRNIFYLKLILLSQKLKYTQRIFLSTQQNHAKPELLTPIIPQPYI